MLATVIYGALMTIWTATIILAPLQRRHSPGKLAGQSAGLALVAAGVSYIYWT